MRNFLAYFVQDLLYVCVCWFGNRCHRDFTPTNPCWNCGRTLKQTWHGRH
jgi:hypothetical protein